MMSWVSDQRLKTIKASSKTIAAGVTKYLEINSRKRGARIDSILIKGIVSEKWNISIYAPVNDGVSSPASGDKRDETQYVTLEDTGGLLGSFAVPYNCFLSFENTDTVSNDIDDVTIMYVSAGILTLTWED